MDTKKLERLMFEHLNRARKSLKKRGAFITTAQIYDDSGLISDTLIDSNNDHMKRLQQLAFQRDLITLNATAAIVVTDAWLVEQPLSSPPLLTRPSTDPRRVEALTVVARTPRIMMYALQKYQRDDTNYSFALCVSSTPH